MGVISDDLTGAGDTGVQFADRGMKVTVSADVDNIEEIPSDTEVWIISTNSRGYSSSRAARLVRKAVGVLKEWKAGYYYKKIDSTLRGNIGAELDALIEELELDALPLCAAFPQMGRTTVNNVQYLWGREIRETEYSPDIKSPGTGSGLEEILSGQMKNYEKVKVLNASTDGDLERLAEENPVCCFAGASAWAGKLAGAWLSSPRKTPPLLLQPGPVLLLCGSMNPVSLKQVRLWEENGKKIIISGGDFNKNELSGDILIKTPEEESSSALKKLVKMGEKIFEAGEFRRAVLCGGDTAREFLGSLGVNTLSVIKSAAPGSALVSSGDFFFILKPGGYGDPESFLTLAGVLGGR